MTPILDRKSMMRWMTHVNRLDAWLGAMLLSRQRAGAGVAVSIAIFCILGVFVLLLMKPAETLFMDSTEAYAWGMQFLGGYGRHPPLTGWIARVWYSVFPATHWSSYALSGVMIGISIGSIYLIGLRVLGRRRATLIVFAMMFYPLFIGAKADRFNNYQVLLAVLPLTIWLFLRAYDKPNVRSGIALGLSAAAATLTIYSATFGLIGIALAALIHPRRRKFFTHPAPYVAVITYLLALSPHLGWLVHNDFSSLRWAESFVDRVSHRAHVLTYLGQHFGLVGFCLVGAVISLIPWRLRAGPIDAPPPTDRLHILIIAAVLMGGPALMGLAFNVFLKPDWGNPFFFLVPIAVLSLVPGAPVCWLRAGRLRDPWSWPRSLFLPCCLVRRSIPGCVTKKSWTMACTGRFPRLRPRSRGSGTSAIIRGCRSSPRVSRLPRRSCSTVPIIRRCFQTSTLLMRRGSTIRVNSSKKALSACALRMTPAAGKISRRSIPMPGRSNSRCTGGCMGS